MDATRAPCFSHASRRARVWVSDLLVSRTEIGAWRSASATAADGSSPCARRTEVVRRSVSTPSARAWRWKARANASMGGSVTTRTRSPSLWPRHRFKMICTARALMLRENYSLKYSWIPMKYSFPFHPRRTRPTPSGIGHGILASAVVTTEIDLRVAEFLAARPGSDELSRVAEELSGLWWKEIERLFARVARDTPDRVAFSPDERLLVDAGLLDPRLVPGV